jgi:RNA recognition motif-containing protein
MLAMAAPTHLIGSNNNSIETNALFIHNHYEGTMATHDASSQERFEAPHLRPLNDESESARDVSMGMATKEYNDCDVATSIQLETDDNVQGSRNHQAQSSTTSSASSCDTTSLFVGGLHPRIGDLHLQKLFSPYGEIVRINIVTNNPSDSQSHNIHSKTVVPAKYKVGLHQSKGYAFVEYTSVESAQLAISRLDGRQLMGKTLAVRPSRRKTNNQDRVGPGVNAGKTGTAVSAEEARREYKAVQSKIEAVKRAIEQNKKGL